jgi:hypothetical protein
MCRHFTSDIYVPPVIFLISLDNESFNVITSFMPFMNSLNLAKVFREYNRILKKGQFLAIMVGHPCFFSLAYRIVSNLTGERYAIQNSNYFLRKLYKELMRLFKLPQKEFQIVRFPYMLFDRIQALIESKFKIDSILKPQSSERACEKMPNLRFWKEQASLYLYIKATKIEI